MSDLDAFARLIGAVEPWRAHLVLVGGWAHRLYRFHPLANAPAYQPLLTRDADLAFANRAPLEGDIRQALLESGFTEELSGEHRPPVTHYTLGTGNAGFYAEFLTPLEGPNLRRSGEPDATVRMAGITAQKLRSLGILLTQPWLITVGANQGIPLPEPTGLLVANPVAFIVQKMLIRDERTPAKRAQDVLYVHDTLELFGAALPALGTLWADEVRPALGDKKARQVIDSFHTTFSVVTDILRDAALMRQDRMLAPERMQAFCKLALDEIRIW